MLSVFYKVASGAITRRVSSVYEQLVGPHQVAYSTSRNISSVPINIINAIQSTLDNREQALVVALDFKKAFDSLSHSYISQILELLNFGPVMIKYVKLFFEGRKTQLLISGILGEKIPLNQSVPQGDILSPMIFNISNDPLLLKIIHTKNLKGVLMGGKKSVILKQNTTPPPLLNTAQIRSLMMQQQLFKLRMHICGTLLKQLRISPLSVVFIPI